ncbi:MAG: hypothetical protein ACLTA5_06660 [Anaerococcus obesiensis]
MDDILKIKGLKSLNDFYLGPGLNIKRGSIVGYIEKMELENLLQSN